MALLAAACLELNYLGKAGILLARGLDCLTACRQLVRDLDCLTAGRQLARGLDFPMACRQRAEDVFLSAIALELNYLRQDVISLVGRIDCPMPCRPRWEDVLVSLGHDVILLVGHIGCLMPCRPLAGHIDCLMLCRPLADGLDCITPCHPRAMYVFLSQDCVEMYTQILSRHEAHSVASMYGRGRYEVHPKV